MSSTTAPTAPTATTAPTSSASPNSHTSPTGAISPVTAAVPLVGSGFGEALHEGLVRAAARMSSRPGPLPLMSSATTLGSWETGAVLDRFTARLPSALAPAEAEVPTLRTTLTEFARTALARAADATPAPTPIAPPAASRTRWPPRSPCSSSAPCCTSWRTASHTTRARCPRGRGRPAPRRGRPGSRGGHVIPGDDGRGERRRLARQLHDGLGGALSLARLSLDAAATCAPVRTGSPASGSPGAVAAHLATAQRALAVAARENQALIDGVRHRADLPPLREALDAFLALVPATAAVSRPASR